MYLSTFSGYLYLMTDSPWLEVEFCSAVGADDVAGGMILEGASHAGYYAFGLIWLQNICFDCKSLIIQNCQSQLSSNAS